MYMISMQFNDYFTRIHSVVDKPVRVAAGVLFGN